MTKYVDHLLTFYLIQTTGRMDVKFSFEKKETEKEKENQRKKEK